MRCCEGTGFSPYVQRSEAEKAEKSGEGRRAAEKGADWHAVFMKSNGGHFECCYDK